MMMKKQIITIAGGGSTYTPGIVQAILNNEKRLPLSEIRLYDIDEERNMDMYLIVKFMLKRKGFSNIRIR
ncbi:maltose-6'-phosphate glucosidase, partial [Enterococcus faecium]|nr:maltose-6'-phosphate glucosidase [Enterococcus faecium]